MSNETVLPSQVVSIRLDVRNRSRSEMLEIRDGIIECLAKVFGTQLIATSDGTEVFAVHDTPGPIPEWEDVQ